MGRLGRTRAAEAAVPAVSPSAELFTSSPDHFDAMTPTFTFEVALGEPDVPNYAPSPTIGRAAPTKGVRSSAPAAAGVAAGAAARNRPHRAEATGAARAPAYSAVTGAPRSR